MHARPASLPPPYVRRLTLAPQAHPPVYKNYPPVAGAIAWARSLYLKQKRPIMRFRTMDRLMKRPSGEEFKAAYLEFAKVCAGILCARVHACLCVRAV